MNRSYPTLLRAKRQRKNIMMMKKRGGVISQEVNPRPPIIKVRLNKSFLSRKELASPRRRRSLLSKGKDEEGDVSFNSCNASSEEEGYSESRSSEECLVHPIDAAIVKGPNLIAKINWENSQHTSEKKFQSKLFINLIWLLYFPIELGPRS